MTDFCQAEDLENPLILLLRGTQLAFVAAMPRRILIAKPGLDGHDRGAKVIARTLRDAGHEVVYSGLHQTPSQIAETAVQEDVDAVGMSSLSGAHRTLFPQVVEQLKTRGAADIIVFGGGVIPDADHDALKSAGIAMIFTPGTPLDEITAWVDENIPLRDQ
jgi:methylmalonyl-CoA mutase C-terminal domain/subunit